MTLCICDIYNSDINKAGSPSKEPATSINSLDISIMTQQAIAGKKELPGMTQVGDRYQIGNYDLQCIQVNSFDENPTTVTQWEIRIDGKYAGAVSMGWDAKWRHNLNKQEFSSPYDAVVSLHECINQRRERANEVEIAEAIDGSFAVKSNGSIYTVKPNHSNPKERCECGDCFWRGAYCKHQMAVQNFTRTLLEQIGA